jgi:hypothetical protein
LGDSGRFVRQKEEEGGFANSGGAQAFLRMIETQVMLRFALQPYLDQAGEEVGRSGQCPPAQSPLVFGAQAAVFQPPRIVVFPQYVLPCDCGLFR